MKNSSNFIILVNCALEDKTIIDDITAKNTFWHKKISQSIQTVPTKKTRKSTKKVPKIYEPIQVKKPIKDFSNKYLNYILHTFILEKNQQPTKIVNDCINISCSDWKKSHHINDDRSAYQLYWSYIKDDMNKTQPFKARMKIAIKMWNDLLELINEN